MRVQFVVATVRVVSTRMSHNFGDLVRREAHRIQPPVATSVRAPATLQTSSAPRESLFPVFVERQHARADSMSQGVPIDQVSAKRSFNLIVAATDSQSGRLRPSPSRDGR